MLLESIVEDLARGAGTDYRELARKELAELEARFAGEAEATEESARALMRAGKVSGCAVFNEYYRELYKEVVK